MASITITRRPRADGSSHASILRRARALLRSPLTWLCVGSALPVVIAAVREMAIGWIPEGDDAMLATRIHDVFTADPPLQGMRSTSNFFGAELSTHHPGPLEFYLEAPIAAVTGYSGAGIVAATALLNVACVVGAVILGHRMRGMRTALPVVGALLLAQWQLGPDVLARPLNPSAGTLPLLLMIIGAWAVLDGDPNGLWVTLLAGSFAAQTELAFCPVVLVVAGTACVVAGCRAWRETRQWRSARPRRADARDRRRRLLTGGALLLAWLPSLIELLLIHPNNLHLVLRFLTNSSRTRGTSTGVSGGFAYLMGRLSPTELGRFGPSIERPPGGLAVALGMVVLVLLLLAAAAGPRLPRTAGSRASWLMLLTIAAESVAVSSKTDALSARLWLLPVLVITPLVYGVLVLRAIEVARGLRSTERFRKQRALLARLTSPIACVVATSIAAVCASALATAPSAENSDRARAVSTAVIGYLDTHDRRGAPVRIDSHGLQSWISLAPALAFQLVRDDHPAHYLGTWPYPEDNDSWYVTTAPRDAVVVTLADAGSVIEAHPGPDAVEVPLPSGPAASIRLWITMPATGRA